MRAQQGSEGDVAPTSIKRVLTSDTSALVLSNLSAALLGVLTGLVTARALGPAGRGDLAVVLLWPSLLTSLLDAGISESLTLRISRNPARWRQSVRAGLVIASAAGLVALGVGHVFLSSVLQRDQRHLLTLTRAALLFVPASLLSSVAIGALLGLERFRLLALIRVASVVVYLVALLVAVGTQHASVEVVTWLTVGSRLLPAAAAGTILLAGLVAGRGAEVAAQAQEGLALQSARTATVVSGSTDRLVANFTLSQAAIGQWQVIVALNTVMQFVSQGISQKLLASMGAREKLSLLPAYARAVALTTLCAAVAMPLLPWAVPVLYGPGFSAAVVPAMVVLGSSILGAGAATLQTAARATGRVRGSVVSEIIGMVVTVAVALPASGWLGMTGIAVGMIAGRLTSLSVMVRVVKEQGGIAAYVPGTREFRCALGRLRHNSAGAVNQLVPGECRTPRPFK